MSVTTVFRARRILTMDPNGPEGTHIAVRDGRVLAVGGSDCAAPWGGGRLDDRYAEAVLMPGLIEAHAHVMAGGVWRYTYCGHYSRRDPDGSDWPGLRETEALIARLRDAAAALPPGAPLIGWGFDPNFVPGPRLTRHDLDRVAEDRPVIVAHSNFHLLTCNTAALQAAGMAEGSNLPGVIQGADGRPNGELQEFAAMGPVMQVGGIDFAALSNDRRALEAYGRVARSAGVTTAADLLSDLDEDEVAMLEAATADPAFPIRYAPVMNAMRGAPEAEAARARALRPRSTDKLRLGAAKLFTDGAIQGRTALLLPPGYLTPPDHGLWNMEPEHFRAAVRALHTAGVQTHIHTNGDAASLAAIEAYEAAMLETPNADHRHVLEHVQLGDRAQFRRMRALGLTVNLFTNHVYYFGDVHLAATLGPDRAKRMNAARDAWEIFDGDFAIHSDAPVTPMAPLMTAWIACNRVTETGQDMGRHQRLTLDQALRCITLGAAYALKLEGEVGSLACGRRADMTVLGEDPHAVGAAGLKDIPVLGTVLGGVPT